MTYKREITTHCEAETQALAAILAGEAQAGLVIGLTGPMGAGKTAFTRGFVSALGQEASSPTFTIVHEYATQPIVYHFDFYRLQQKEELEDIGFEEYLLANGIIIAEWPKDFLPIEQLAVVLCTEAWDERKILLTATGELHINWLKRCGL